MSQIQIVTCNDFDFLLVAGPPRSKMPEHVQALMNQHEAVCPHHGGEAYHKALLDIQATPDMEVEAMRVVGSYS